MKTKRLYSLIMIIPTLLIIVFSILALSEERFMGLEPKAIYRGYKIYDIIEQKGLACAEMVEYLDSDNKYDYYFPCLKSSQIYFVNDEAVINVREAYKKRIITLEKLYELNIVDRMVRQGVK